MFMLDNSGSMKNTLAESSFDSSKTYYGMFDGTKKYRYDVGISIDMNGYNGLPYDIDANNDGVTDSDDVDAIPGAFVETSICMIGVGSNCWDGSFLNWMVTRRIDAARKVMIGGKVESRHGADYIGGDGGDLEWKIVANNERSDPDLHRTYSASQTHTPYPDNTAFEISSPAKSGAVHSTAALDPYDPYAKIKVSAPPVIFNNTSTVIGEYGTISRCGADAGAGNWYTVSLTHDYNNPVVVATPLSYYGAGPSVVRISDVDSTTDSFNVRIEEWEYLDARHTGEDVSFLVFERGTHTLAGGQKIVAGSVNINTSDTVVDISGAAFIDTPVVISSVTTNNDSNTVTTRQKSITTSEFTVSLQEEQAGGSHATETVSYIALDQGAYADGVGTGFYVGI